MISEVGQLSRPPKYQFGDFELSPTQGVLWRDGRRVPVMPKPMAALIVLVEHAGETVSKEQLLAEVWGGAAVEENNVTQTISSLRKTLGEKRGENRFIATDPGNGYRFVAAVTHIAAATLDLSEVRVDQPTARVAARSSRRKFVFAAAVVLALAGAAALWLYRSPTNGVRRKSVAILSIRDLSKTSSEAWLQTALPEMLTSELASAGKLRTIPADDIVRWRSGIASTLLTAGNAGLLRLAHRNFDVEAFVIGSYVVTGTCPGCRVRVDLGVFDAHTGESLAAIIDEAPAQDLLDLTTRLGAKLRANFGVSGPRAEPAPWPAASAMREYAEGLNALRRIDPMAARDHLQSAAAVDSGNALIHSALADAWTALGYASRASEESRRAYELSSSLSRLDQLGIEARYRAAAGQWDRAIEIYQSIFRLFPDSLEDGLNLARAQFRGMKGADSIATLRLLRKFPKPAGNDPRIDLLEAQDAGMARDYMKTRDFAHRAAEEAKARGALYLFARARLLEGGARQSMGDPGYYDIQVEARKVCEQLGDRQCVASSWRMRGNTLVMTGKFSEARDAYLQGTSVARELGDKAELANILNGMGVLAESNQEWDQASQNFLEAIALKKETGYNASEVQVQLVELYRRTGRLEEAARVADEAYSEAQKTNSREQFGEIFWMRSELTRAAGRLKDAEDLTQKAIVEFRASNSMADLTMALTTLSTIRIARGNLQNAQTSLAEASKLYDSTHRSVSSPEVRGEIELARANLLLAQGSQQQATEEARRSAADLSTAHIPEDASRALILEATALSMLGKNSEALDAEKQAQNMIDQSPDPASVAWVRLTAWSLGAESKEPSDLRARVAALKNPELSLEEELARAVQARRSGTPDSSRLFEAVATRATGAGYVTLSRRARTLAQ
ncbi:MAG TPA: winged helix-turn-helix domain-containing protein [Bryobacteraceae bacterium]|nr:winged helix-turn-helix domain-containing protein [Bryobacteraceae bacterium]